MIQTQPIKSPISRRLILYIVSFSILGTLLTTAIQLYRDYNTNIELVNADLMYIENTHLKSLSSALWLSNRKLLQISIEGILAMPDVQYVEISDEQELWVKAGEVKGDNNIQKSFSMDYHHRNSDVNIGTLTVNISLDGVYQRLLDTVWVILVANTIQIFLVTLLLYILVYRLVARHLSAISEYLEKYDTLAGNKSLVLNRKGNKQDEFEAVVKSINNMRDRIGKQVSEISHQKQYLLHTLESIGDAVITTDENGKVTGLNPVAQQLTGWTKEEALQQPLQTIFHVVDASTKEPITNLVDTVLTTGNTVHLSNHSSLIAKDGKEYQISDSAAAIRDGDEILGMVLVFNDVSEQYQMREALYESEQRFRQLAEHIDEVFWIGAPDWNKVFYISPAYEKKWGLSAEALYKKPLIWIESVHPDDREQVFEDIPKDLDSIDDFVDFREYRILKTDGEVFFFFDLLIFLLNYNCKR